MMASWRAVLQARGIMPTAAHDQIQLVVAAEIAVCDPCRGKSGGVSHLRT
jgi:hypothetical protein